MIFHSKKAQSAMEYLMTYGWAILIILIAIGALFYLGVFSPKTANMCSPVAPLAQCDVKISVATNSISVVFSSASIVASSIKITGLDFPGTTNDCTIGTPVILVNSGQGYPFTCTHSFTVGKTYAGDALIEYQIPGGVIHQTRLAIVGTVEA